MPNRYGLDYKYFQQKLGLIVRDADNYTPAEMRRSLESMAEVAKAQEQSAQAANDVSPDEPTKVCKVCQLAKPLSEFFRAVECKQGRQTRCKVCQKAYVRSLGAKKGGRKHLDALDKRNREKYPQRYKARLAVRNAVARGIIVKPERCEVCQQIRKLHGHHDDYSREMEVRWLCSECHGDWHREHGDARNGR